MPQPVRLVSVPAIVTTVSAVATAFVNADFLVLVLLLVTLLFFV